MNLGEQILPQRVVDIVNKDYSFLCDPSTKTVVISRNYGKYTSCAQNTVRRTDLSYRTGTYCSTANFVLAITGNILHWWNAYPIPSDVSAPYNNSTEFGVAPGWGYAIVLESTIDAIPPGRFVFGFVPISSHTFDLKLNHADIAGHWIDCSPHRSKVMSMYQRYNIMPNDFDIDSTLANWTAALIKCEAGMTLAKYVFPQDGSSPIHPFGRDLSTWSETEADLPDACIVNIASGTKTAKAFIWHLANIGRLKKPKYSLVEITSGSGCEKYIRDSPFIHTTVSYEAIESAGIFPKHRKYVLLNFGGRGNAMEQIYNTIRAQCPEAEILVVQIGSEAKVGTRESVMKTQEIVARIGAVQMNTTEIRDEAVKRYGESKYFEALDSDFEALVSEQVSTSHGKVLGMTLNVSHGLDNEKDVYGLWTRISHGQISGYEAFAVQL